MNPVEEYICELRDIHRSGEAVKETSYYPPLAHLLNTVGKTLKPQVRCIINIKNRGAGIPDGGLFTAEQLRKDIDNKPFVSQIPSRGAIEIKGTSENIIKIAESDQVSRYLKRYGQVLVTNYRGFLLVGLDLAGNPVKLESYHLAKNEQAFWELVSNPRKMADEHGERLIEYLKRVTLHAAPLMDPEDLAKFLASYARDAKFRIEQKRLPALDTIRSALESALGLSFSGQTKEEDQKAEHFFNSTLIQTIFYGIFSAWILWSKQQDSVENQEKFNWRTAAWYLHVPMIKALFEQIVTPTKLGPLDLVEVLDWTGTVLNRVDKNRFFAKFDEGLAVQYFYEPFLQAFDPELRKELGVWYTPPEIVKYMVARVNKVLKEELNIEDGFADPNVYVLDPSCGTGAYLVEILRCISATLEEKGGDALSNYEIKKAATKRVLGFEILPAPFVVAHLQLGLLLQNLGVPLLDEKKERAGVYLTNSLTGWEIPDSTKDQTIQLQLAGMPELKEERDTSSEIKRNEPVLVVIGNPPYNAFAGISPKEEQGMVDVYKDGLASEWGVKKYNLDDLYIRFFRLAENRIAEKTGRGIVCYISNHSWITETSFVVLRKHLLSSFDKFWIENMHGDRKNSEYALDGRTSETIFAVPGFSAGIQQGVVISLWLKDGEKNKNAEVYFRDDLDAAKAVERRAQLIESLTQKDFNKHYIMANPNTHNKFSFKPSDVSSHYLEWPKIIEFCGSVYSNGLMEKRKSSLIDIDKSRLEQRMKMYYDRKVDWSTLKSLQTGLTEDAARFDAKKARAKVLAAENFSSDKMQRYTVRPFENRWCYYSSVRPLWNEPRPSLWAQCWDGNSFLLSRMAAAKDPEGSPFYFAKGLSDDHVLSPDATCFPIQINQVNNVIHNSLFEANDLDFNSAPQANLSKEARDYLISLGINNPDIDVADAELIWMHSLAIGYSPMYLTENKDGIQGDWPRIPLPTSREQLFTSARLGKIIADLLNVDQPIAGVSSGTIQIGLRRLGIISRVGEGTLNPDSNDLLITVGWGHLGKDGVTMPGRGKSIQRTYTQIELDSLEQAAKNLNINIEQIFELLGDTTYDIYLNAVAYWKNIPQKVWEYTIGGYQVIKKWLSYREHTMLGRAITKDEVYEITDTARRMAALLLMSTELDLNYQTTKMAPFVWLPRKKKSDLDQ